MEAHIEDADAGPAMLPGHRGCGLVVGRSVDGGVIHEFSSMV
jgi:hypothetical protein